MRIIKSRPSYTSYSISHPVQGDVLRGLGVSEDILPRVIESIAEEEIMLSANQAIEVVSQA